jgi:pimeloyl-ACP methyl ester carboxylesterase
MTMSEAESLFLDIAGQRHHVVCWGDPEAPPLLLIHGIRDHARSWDWVANALGDRYRIHAPDLRGHGDSDWTAAHGYTLAEYGLDLADIVDALRLDKFAVVGHSFGGHLALRDEKAEPKPQPQRLREWMKSVRLSRERRPRSYASLAGAMVRMQTEQPLVDSETIEHLARHGMRANPDGSLSWKFDQATRLRPPDDASGRALDQILAAIACPVQLFYGTSSWIPMPPAERMALLRNLNVVTVPDVSHWLHHQARETYIAKLSAFLMVHHKA